MATSSKKKKEKEQDSTFDDKIHIPHALRDFNDNEDLGVSHGYILIRAPYRPNWRR